jgi:hypothetical protein
MSMHISLFTIAIPVNYTSEFRDLLKLLRISFGVTLYVTVDKQMEKKYVGLTYISYAETETCVETAAARENLISTTV